MKLAILDDYENVALKLADWNSLGPEIEIDVYHDHLDAGDELVDRLCPYDILVIMRERTPFPRRLIEQLPSLKLLVTTGARNLAIDLPACREQGIVVCATGSSKSAAAELAWALILSTLRRIPQQDRTTREGCWGDGIGSALFGKVLGVLGLGKLGTQVTRVGLAFGMEVVAWSQNLTPERASEAGAFRVEKDELFAKSDIVTIHVVLSDRTRGVIGAHEIGLMKPTAYIINTSRGYQNEQIPKARGRAAQMLRQAEGYERERVAMAEGDVARVLALAKEYRKAPSITKERLYLETMTSVLPRFRKVIVDEDASIINLNQLFSPGAGGDKKK